MTGFLHSLAWLLALAAVAPLAQAQIGVSPPYHDISATDAERTQTFRIHNFTEQPIAIRVRVAPWHMREDGQVELEDSSAESLDQWVVANPLQFKVQPNASQAVRFAIRPAVPLTPGEHRVMFVFDQDSGAAPDGGAMHVKFQLRSAVYVQVGEAMRSAEIVETKVEAAQGSLLLQGTGTANARLEGQAVLWRADAFPGEAKTALLPGLDTTVFSPPVGALAVVQLPRTPVLPGSKVRLALPWPKPVDPGRYVLDLNGTIGSAALDRSFPVEVRK